MVGRYAIHILCLFRYASEEISTTDNDCQFNAHCVNFCNLLGNFMDTCDVDTKTTVGRQRFTGKLEKDSFIHSYLSIADVYGRGEMHKVSTGRMSLLQLRCILRLLCATQFRSLSI